MTLLLAPPVIRNFSNAIFNDLREKLMSKNWTNW